MTNFAHENEVKAGAVLIADGGFTCIKAGAELVVRESKEGLYVPCDCGNHYIDSRLDRRKEYVGFSLKSGG